MNLKSIKVIDNNECKSEMSTLKQIERSMSEFNA